MHAISLWQPWATLLALGEKTWETRPYPLPKSLAGQWMAIHATLHVERAAWSNPVIVQALDYWGITWGNATSRPGSLPQRAIVAVVKFSGSSRTEDVAGELPPKELALGDYTAGRFAWQVDGLVGLNSHPVEGVRGHQRFWQLDPDTAQGMFLKVRQSGIDLPADFPRPVEKKGGWPVTVH